MKNYDFVLAGIALVVGLGCANYMIGRCYWRHPKLTEWISGLFSAAIILVSVLNLLLFYYPTLTERLKSPVNVIIALIVIMGLSTAYRRCFIWGDRTAYRSPDPNQPYEVDDIPPMPSTKSY